MKKARFLIFVLAAAIMLLGASYAYWQETLTIENTVTTGELDFMFKDAGIVDVDTYMDVYGVSSCEVGADDNNIEIKLYDMYPGAEAEVEFKLENTGTMKALVKNFTVSDFAQKEHIQITSFKVGEQVLVNAPVSLAAFSTAEIIGIEPGDDVAVELILQIDPDATEDDVAENLSGEGAIEFSITADGLQYNDDIN